MLQCFVRAANPQRACACPSFEHPCPRRSRAASAICERSERRSGAGRQCHCAHDEQQSTHAARTNGEGFYDLLALPPGAYEITFEAPASSARSARA